MSFYLEETCNIPFDFAYAKLAEDVIAFCLSHENFPYEAEVNLTLTDNEEIHRINLEYRQIDRPTDVLSFPMLSYEKAGDFSFLEEESEDDFNPDTGEVMLGDIIISVDKVLEQAQSYGHSPKRESSLSRLRTKNLDGACPGRGSWLTPQGHDDEIRRAAAC